ncbi:hypothetical protein [Qaidamihabitans albus]|uniref:hypothetical protein n=1 Tax=Qaidamihabitans albus TaxID=2795733 RepID=UPI0018F11267|nr:hypothetical protein [Qaidamihabitans albus]
MDLQADQVRIIGEAIGREVRWEELSPQETRTLLADTHGNVSLRDPRRRTGTHLPPQRHGNDADEIYPADRFYIQD